MKKIIESMNRRVKILKTAIKVAEREKDRFPKGRLRVSQTRNQIRYYQVESSELWLRKTITENFLGMHKMN